MTTEAFEHTHQARQWAFRTLNFRTLSDDCSYRPSDITWLLATVTEADYQLPGDDVNAAQIVARTLALDQSPAIGIHAMMAGRHHQLREEVADFTSVFFELTIGTRTQRWQALAQRCLDFPDLATQLDRLKPALEITFPSSIEDPLERQLLQTCREAFLASNPTAARIRRRFCSEWRKDPETWEKVVDAIVLKHDDLIQTIAPWIDAFGDQRFHETGLRPIRYAEHLSLHAGINAHDRSLKRTAKTATNATQPEAPQVWIGTLWIWVTIAMIVITLILLVAGDPAVTPIDTFHTRPFGSTGPF